MQTVTVVPVQRLRRATTGWSYKCATAVQAGSLVIVPFRGRPALGVVWDTDESTKATLQVSEVLTTTPLVRAPHRRLIEWLAEDGICSLSTALYVWLPAALRELPLTKPVREALQVWDAEQPSAKTVALAKQHAVLVPSRRENAEASLETKYQASFQSTFADTTPAQEFETWKRIAHGKITVATGRERALFAPWLNLRHITVIEPEDISYHTGQSPYVNLVDGTRILADATQAELTCRTNVPLAAAYKIWPTASGLPQQAPSVELTDLRHARILSESVIAGVKATVARHEHVILLYNAHDRMKQEEDGTRSVIPGIETLARQLAAALDLPALPAEVLLGTRTILSDLPRPIGLAVVLSLDPLLNAISFADKLHGWGDIGRLLQTGAPLVVQTRHPEHPLPQALVRGSFTAYCEAEVAAAQKLQMPPFGEEIVCALPEGKPGKPTESDLAQKLQALATPPWRVSHPREAHRRGKPVTIISLYAPLGTRLPHKIRAILAALPRPWKVERGPWYAS